MFTALAFLQFKFRDSESLKCCFPSSGCLTVILFGIQLMSNYHLTLSCSVGKSPSFFGSTMRDQSLNDILTVIFTYLQISISSTTTCAILSPLSSNSSRPSLVWQQL